MLALSVTSMKSVSPGMSSHQYIAALSVGLQGTEIPTHSAYSLCCEYVT